MLGKILILFITVLSVGSSFASHVEGVYGFVDKVVMSSDENRVKIEGRFRLAYGEPGTGDNYTELRAGFLYYKMPAVDKVEREKIIKEWKTLRSFSSTECVAFGQRFLFFPGKRVTNELGTFHKLNAQMKRADTYPIDFVAQKLHQEVKKIADPDHFLCK